MENNEKLYQELRGFIGGMVGIDFIEYVANQYNWEYIGENKEGTKLTLIEGPMDSQIDLEVSTVIEHEVVILLDVKKVYWY